MKKIRTLIFLACATSFFAACSSNNSTAEEYIEEIPVGQSIVSEDIRVTENARSYLFDTLQVKEAKLVFRNDETGNLVYIHFLKDSTEIYEFHSGIDIYHPTISPDGRYVAYSTSLEGAPRTSHLYVQDLSENSPKIVRLDDEGAIPRWRVHSSQDTVLIYVDNAQINVENSDWNASKTKKVSFKNGQFGTPKFLLQGAYHGGVTEDLRLAVTGARYLRVHSEIGGVSKDTIWYNSAQVCNVSLSTDGSLRTLFLDLGDEQGIEFSKEEYLPHHHILIADSTGKLVQALPALPNYSFDHPEWVYGSDRLILFTLTDNAHANSAIIDAQDSSVRVLAKGNEIWHPDIWFEK